MTRRGGLSWRVWWTLAAATQLIRSANFLPSSDSPLPAIDRFGIDVSYLPFIWVLMHLATRWPLEGRRLAPHLLYHATASVLVTAVQLTAIALFLVLTARLRASGADVPTKAVFTEVFMPPVNITLHLVWYWAVVGSLHAFRYYSESREKTEAIAQLRARLTEERLHALRSQLNPHFLFNTLNTISAAALKSGNEQIVEMVSRLAMLLRITLDDERPDIIPLEEELDFIASYVELHRLRFADRLTVEWDIDPNVRATPVPSMILQPLVENAVKHGVCACPGPAQILVRAHPAGDMLQMEVADSGPGFSATDYTPALKHVGLTNTEARLEQMYGAAHRVDYRNTSLGASVTISIPLQGGRVGTSGFAEEQDTAAPVA